MAKEKDVLRKQREDLKKKIASLPKGSLLFVQNGKYIKWYKSNGANPVYIPKKKRILAESLALKKYYEVKLNEIEEKLIMIETYLADCVQIKSQMEGLMEVNSCFGELLRPILEKNRQEIINEQNAEYIHCNMHPENLIYQTYAGINVRSKSEVTIANALFLNEIPFVYERGMKLGEIVFYPDFTIYHPITKQIIYWEHFGMMDNQTYRDGTYNKLKMYCEHDIIPTINLITTYETKGHPLNPYEIERMIQDYFSHIN